MKGRHLVSTITLAASLIVAIPLAHAASGPNSYALQSHEVLFNGLSHVSGIRRSTCTGRAWHAVASNVNGTIVKAYGAPYYPPAEFELPVNGAQALARAITDLSAGRQVRLHTQVHVAAFDQSTPEWTNLGDSELAYFEFPKLDANSKSGGYFKMAVVPTTFTPMADKLAGTSAPVAAPAPVFLANGFVVTIPGLDCTRVMSVDGIRIGGSADAGSSVASGEFADARPSAESRNGNITIRATAVTSRGLRDWMLANQTGGPTKREITIQLVSASGAQPLLTLHGVGVGLMSVMPDPAVNEGIPIWTATLFVERWEVTAPGGPGMVRGKVDLAAPGFGIPGGRK